MIYQSSILSRHAGVMSHSRLVFVGLESEGNEVVHPAATQVEALKCGVEECVAE